MIKKIEHFWKGLSSDRTQISALPPEDYGDRFIKFMSGITMSPEQAERDEYERRAAAEAAATAEAPNEADSRRSSLKPSPPAPTYLPPPPPGMRSPHSPDPNPTVEKAMKKATKHEKDVAKEEEVPERHITTTIARNSNAVLPIVEETAEAGSLSGQRSRSGSRPFTPSERDDGYTDLGPHGIGGRGPPTPPKTSYLEAAGKGSDGGPQRPMNRGSLTKRLPPLPQ
jgi:1-phosphatidylinositol-4-phosphate 5-kinase